MSEEPSDPTRSAEIDKLIESLAKAMALVENPERNRKVKVIPRSGGQGYEFAYATLSAIMDAIRKPLTDNGIWFSQIMKEDQNGAYILDTRLMHSSGQWIACQTPLIWDGTGNNQQFGSALTFMRRYALTSLLGIAAEEDDDANAADGNEIVGERKPASAKPDVMVNPVTPQVHFSPAPLSIAPEPGKAVDWSEFGRSLIAYVRGAADYKEADTWILFNQEHLDEMKLSAPKMYNTLAASLDKVMSDKGAK